MVTLSTVSSEIMMDTREKCEAVLIRLPHMNTGPVDRSQSGGTGPSAYGNGPTVINDLGPVPNYCFTKNCEDYT